MKPIYSQVIKTIAFAPPWIAIVLAGLAYITTGKWMGTLWGEVVMLLIAVAITLIIYRTVVGIERRKYK